MKTINLNQLAQILGTVKGSTPINISALVDTRARKTDNPYAGIYKLSKINGMTGTDYAQGVRNRQEKEGNEPVFEAQARKWGTRISPALVENKGKKYLSFRPLTTSKPIYFAKQASGFLKQTKKEEIAQFLPDKKSAAQTQGVEKEVVYRDYSLDAIVSISIGGEKYRVRH